MLKVRHVITGLRPAGAERVLVSLCRGLVAREVDTSVISLMPFPRERDVVDALRSLDIPVTSLGITRSNPASLFGAPRVLREGTPDILHAHLFHPGLLSRLHRGRARPPWVVNTVHMPDRRPSRFWQFWADRLTRAGCDRYTAVSASVRDYHAGRTGINPAAVEVIPNGVAVPKPLDPRQVAEVRSGWGFADCDRVLGGVGRLVPLKGWDAVLRSLPSLARRIPSGERWGW